MAKIIKSETQNTASNRIRRTTVKMVTAIHSKMETINPPMPSPASIEGVLKVGETSAIISPRLNFLNFGKSSTKPIPV